MFAQFRCELLHIVGFRPFGAVGANGQTDHKTAGLFFFSHAGNRLQIMFFVLPMNYIVRLSRNAEAVTFCHTNAACPYVQPEPNLSSHCKTAFPFCLTFMLIVS